MNEVSKINTNRQIKQSNNLCEARYKLTKYEQRMVIAICSQIDDRKDELPIIKVKATDLADFCEFDKSKKYTMVKTTARTLRSRTLEYQMPNGDWYITGWINSAFYDSKDSTITFTFDERLKPELLKLKSAYLLTPAEPLMKFDRDYSVRLYFILKKMLKIKDFEYDLDYFRDRFQLGKTYNKLSNLKDRVLEPALDEINEKSDISVSHEYIKEGRAYKKIHFIVTLKEQAPVDERAEQPPQITSSAADKKSKTELANYTEEEIEKIVELQAYGLKRKMAETKIKEYGIDGINKAIENLKSTIKPVANPAGYIISFLKFLPTLEEQKTEEIYKKQGYKTEREKAQEKYNIMLEAVKKQEQEEIVRKNEEAKKNVGSTIQSKKEILKHLSKIARRLPPR